MDRRVDFRALQTRFGKTCSALFENDKIALFCKRDEVAGTARPPERARAGAAAGIDERIGSRIRRGALDDDQR
jgi:hypothetical protein